MSKLAHLKFYLRKHGPVGLCKRFLTICRTKVLGQIEWLYALDLDSHEIAERSNKQGMVLLRLTEAGQLDSNTRSALLRFKSDFALQTFIDRWFARGAILWIAKQEDQIVGVQWTLKGGIDGFYSVPVLPAEVIVVAVEVFPPFRGQGLYPLMAAELAIELRLLGYRRAYLKVAASNGPMQRSMTKTLFSKVASVYTRRLGAKSITVWDMQLKQARKKSFATRREMNVSVSHE